MPYVDYSVDSFCSNCSKSASTGILSSVLSVASQGTGIIKRFKGEKKSGIIVL